MKPRTLSASIASFANAALVAALITIASLSCPIVAEAQAQSDFSSIAFIDGETQMLYNSQNGLQSTVSTAIEQTSDGFIWIGGYEGLTYFDGQTFEAQKEAPSFSVASLLAGDNGSLWIGTSNQGLYRYAGGKYVKADTSECAIDFDEVLCMAEGQDDIVFLGTEHGIAQVNEGGKVSEFAIEGLPDSLVRDIAVSNDGSVVAVTQDGRLFLVANEKASEITLTDVSGMPRCVSFDQNLMVYCVGTNKNAVCLISPDGTQVAKFDIDGANCINQVSTTEAGVVWICADNGVFSCYKGKINKQNLQMDNSVDSMLIDSEGDYWFASSRQGVLLVGNTPFENISSYANMDDCVVNAIVKFEGKFLIGTDQGISVLDPSTDSVVADSRFQAFDYMRIRDMKIDRKGQLWIATSNSGVFRMDESGEWTSFTKESVECITSNNFRCLYETESAMVAGCEEGAVVIDGENVRNVANDPSALNARVMSVAQVGNVLFVGTDSYGVQVIEDGEVVGSITTHNGLPSNSVMKIYPCSDKSTLILATSNGLITIAINQDLSSERFSENGCTVSKIDEFPSSNTLDVIWQDSETVWVAAGKGIYRTTEAALLNDEPSSFKLYSRQDGLPYDITANSTQFVDGDILYLCGTGGVGALDMKKAETSTDSCMPSVTGAYADGQFIPVDENNTISIPADTERVKIMAHATTFDKTNITLFYKLDGYDSRENTTPLSNFNGIEYTNIDGGTYKLQFGAWDETSQSPLNSTTVTIKKEYGLLDNPLTRVVATAFVLAIVLLCLEMRRRRTQARLKREYEEKERRALEKMAYSDFLTEAYNRNYLNTWEKAAHQNAYRFPIALVTLDLNNLKQINDTMGHSAGDEYLQSVTDSIFKSFEKDNAVVVRLGGDEFLVIAEGTQRAAAEQRIKQTQQLLGEKSPDGISYSFCYGIEQIDGTEFSLDETIRIADEQLIEAKQHYHEVHDRRKSVE